MRGAATIAALRTRVALLSTAFAALAVSVALGAWTWLDQGAIDHLMPRLEPSYDGLSIRDAVVPFVDQHGLRDVLADLWLYPASAPISGLIVLLCARRIPFGRVWVAALALGTAIEVLTKWALERPALYSHGLHVEAFDHALPSGHTIRSFLVAAAVARAWPRATRWAWAWAASVWILLVLQGWHVPTDVAAGLLLAWLLALVADHVQRRRVDLRERAPVRDDGEPVAVEP